MFHPESNPLAPKSTGPKKPEKELVRIWLGKDAAAEMEDEKSEMGDEEDLNSKEHELTDKEKRTLWEMKRPDEVILKNIPTWKELPDEETFKKDFKFDWVFEKDYRKGRPIEDFEIQNKTETLPLAKVFDIRDVILEKQKQDSNHPDYLTTSEVLEAIDAAGYRPATFEELLAYGRDHWKPDAIPETLTKAERELQNAQAPFIDGLNSMLSSFYGSHGWPSLFWDGGKRRLFESGLGHVWRVDNRFLVLRKSSPS